MTITDQGLASITAAKERREQAERMLTEAVAAARTQGYGWEAIGTALGVTRVGAYRYYGLRRGIA